MCHLLVAVPGLRRGSGQDIGSLRRLDNGRRSPAFALSLQVFHCVHFECPEQQSSQKEDNSEESGTGDPSLVGPPLDPHALQAPGGSSLPSSPGSVSRSPNRQHQ